MEISGLSISGRQTGRGSGGGMGDSRRDGAGRAAAVRRADHRVARRGGGSVVGGKGQVRVGRHGNNMAATGGKGPTSSYERFEGKAQGEFEGKGNDGGIGGESGGLVGGGRVVTEKGRRPGRRLAYGGVGSNKRRHDGSDNGSGSGRVKSKHNIDKNGIYFQSGSGLNVSEDYIDPKTCDPPTRVPKSLQRPKVWSREAEEAFRLQSCGWRDLYEYEAVYGVPERWPKTDFIRKLQCRKNGFYTYWNEGPECQNKDLRSVKVYSY